MNISKRKIAILMGGPSHEREISLESGRNITYKLSSHKYIPVPVFVTNDMHLFTINNSQLVKNSTREIEQTLKPEQRITWHSLKERFDFVFIGLHGGPGENGAVQGMLEMLNIPYNGSGVFASALCMDKYKTAHYLKAHGFDTPHQVFVTAQEWHHARSTILETIQATIPFPSIIKPHDDGCSIMIQKARTSAELACAIDHIINNKKMGVLIEECLSGMELTVGVIGNEEPLVLPPSQTIASGDILSIEEKFLPGSGENQTPAPLPSDTHAFVQEIIEKIYRAIGLKGYARIDCFYQTSEQNSSGKERLVILEVNTLPGLTPATCIFHQAAEIGLKPTDFIDRIVDLGFALHQTTENATAIESIESTATSHYEFEIPSPSS